MVAAESAMLPLGSPAPEFSLPEPARQNHFVSKQAFTGQPLLVAFICNHCPYVVLIKPALAQFARDYQARGLAMVAINANDVVCYPADHPDRMIEEVNRFGYEFPYLFDASQDVARTYQAVCTPDFFLYDHDHLLVYRGQFDAARPGMQQAPTGSDLRAAADRVFEGLPPLEKQNPSIGCSIKWKSQG